MLLSMLLSCVLQVSPLQLWIDSADIMGLGFSEDRLPILLHQVDEAYEEDRHHQCNPVYYMNNNNGNNTVLQRRNRRHPYRLIPNDLNFRSWIFGNYNYNFLSK